MQCVEDVKAEQASETIQVPSVEDFKPPQERFNSYDENLDGVIELSEAQARATAKATEKFTAQDTDEDGFVTKDEHKAYKKPLKVPKEPLKVVLKK